MNGNNQTKSENKSVFAHTVTDLTDKLSMTLGARYSEDDKDERFDNTIVITSLATSESRFDWRAGFDYQFTDTLLGYVSAATGYRPQSFNPRPFQRTQFVKVDGEEADSYELGVKTDLLERRLRLNGAVFYVDYGKRIVGVPGVECTISNPTGDAPPIYNTVPAGTPGAVTDTLGNLCLSSNTTSRTFYQNFPGKIKGGELEVTYRPIDPLTINASYGYTDFTSDDLDAANVVVDRPPFVPKDNWSVAAYYQFGLSSGATLTPRVDVYGQSEICTGITTLASCSSGYELLNARIEWASPDRAWTTAVGVQNLANKEYFLNKFDLSGFGQPTTEGQPARRASGISACRATFSRASKRIGHRGGEHPSRRGFRVGSGSGNCSRARPFFYLTGGAPMTVTALMVFIVLSQVCMGAYLLYSFNEVEREARKRNADLRAHFDRVVAGLGQRQSRVEPGSRLARSVEANLGLGSCRP